MKHPWAWVSWLVATVVIISITRNPLYLVLILLCILFVEIALQQVGSDIPRPFSLWKIAVWIILLATIFNALTSHYGATVLFIIPGKLPLISGNVTLEALVYGATNGLVLTGMLASFAVLNLALPVRALMSLIPRAFFPVAVVTSIAVTYLPSTLRQFKQIQEAQTVRGHQMRTLRDWQPLLMPLLVGGLEHAMQLAEAMTARGFASTGSAIVKPQNYPRIAMLLGLILLVIGWLAQLSGIGVSGLALITSGTLLILGGLWLMGRRSPRTTYHRPAWSWRDLLTLVVSLSILAACLLPLPWLDRQILYYEPYPLLTPPPFNPLLGMVMLGLLLPGVLALMGNHGDEVKAEGKKQEIDVRTGI